MIGENLKQLRKERNLSLRALAEKAGISKSTLSDIENGNTNPTTNTLSKLAEAFDINLEDLFKSNELNEQNKNDCVKEEVETYSTGNWKDSLGKMKSQEEKIKYLESIVDFADPKEAVQFLLKQPAIMGFGGFDVNQMSDDEVVEFANELLRQLKLISYKYKK